MSRSASARFQSRAARASSRSDRIFCTASTSTGAVSPASRTYPAAGTFAGKITLLPLFTLPLFGHELLGGKVPTGGDDACEAGGGDGDAGDAGVAAADAAVGAPRSRAISSAFRPETGSWAARSFSLSCGTVKAERSSSLSITQQARRAGSTKGECQPLALVATSERRSVRLSVRMLAILALEMAKLPNAP